VGRAFIEFDVKAKAEAMGRMRRMGNGCRRATLAPVLADGARMNADKKEKI
jgi:hypothetical protein